MGKNSAATGGKTRRPLAEMLPMAEGIVQEFLRENVCLRAEIAGSVRRRKPDVGDIEIVAIPRVGERQVAVGTGDLFLPGVQAEVKFYNALWLYLDQQAERGRIRYSKRGEKYRQFDLDGVQVDLFTCVPDGWGWAFLVRTGSAEFSHHVAAQLNLGGYTSKDFRIHRGRVGGRIEGGPILTPEERDVFGLAGMDYVEPAERSAK